jgi:hypothetical protein
MVQASKNEVTTKPEEGRSMNMPCDKWSSILRWYGSAVRIYSSAVAATLSAADAAEFNKAWELSEEARRACERFRTALLEHEHKHGCQAVPEPAAFAIPNKSQPSSGYQPAIRRGRGSPAISVG